MSSAHDRPNEYARRRCVSARVSLTAVSTFCMVALVVVASLLPGIAFANLPDGRVYDEVSPANKNGNVVNNPFTELEHTGSFGLVAADGNAAAFVGSGAMGAATSGMISDYVSRRSSAGWVTESAVPRILKPLEIIATEGPRELTPSADFSKFLFTAYGLFGSAEPLGEFSSTNIFLSTNPMVEPTWLARPTITDPIPAPGHNEFVHDYFIAGATPDLNTVYFTSSGTLVPEDESRAPHVGNGQGNGAWGFYEWHEGALRNAGALPDGTISPYGAVPAALAAAGDFERGQDNWTGQARALDNEVSADGSRAFFVSPDPSSGAPTIPELYVRVSSPGGGKRTELVSQSQLPGHQGETAPHGPLNVSTDAIQGENQARTYAYASSDGSHVFLQSVDQLTAAAPVDGLPKEYDFDVETEALTYLPGAVGAIVAVSPDGSDFIFENKSSGTDELDLWQAGPGGGQVTTIAQLPGPSSSAGEFSGSLDVSDARSSADGSVFVFRTNSPIPGAFNNQAGYAEVYRYAVDGHELTCVSCPPVGTTASGDAQVSYDSIGPGKENGFESEPTSTLDTRVLSADGRRVFFDTPDALVTQDTNGARDVYEWENGEVHLISLGKSSNNSYVLDSSANGADAFFTTDSGLVPGDLDNGYDVYDARIPHPGDNPPPVALPCEGEVCQGPPSTPTLLGVPASAAFNGAGNVINAAPAKTTVKHRVAPRRPRRHKHKHKRRPRAKRSRRGSARVSHRRTK